MSYPASVMKKVRQDYEAKQERDRAEAEKRRDEIHRSIPAVAEIDKALSETFLQIYKAALGGKNGLASRMDQLKRENESLQQARKELLTAAGYPPDYTVIRYECPQCSDTGYVGIDMCQCMRRALRKEAYCSSGLGKMLTHQTFDNFDLTLYSDIPSQAGVSPRENMEYILAEAKKFACEFGKKETNSSGENLIFFGKTGLGKTHISTAIAKQVIDRGYDVVYDTAQNILHEFERERFSKEGGDFPCDRYFDCDLLILDDLGAEFRNSFTQATLYHLLNTRICAGKSMIVSTNLDDARLLKQHYDDRITSRLIGNFRSFRFFGEDIRLKKTRKGK